MSRLESEMIPKVNISRREKSISTLFCMAGALAGVLHAHVGEGARASVC